ncbi:MAG: hypothetical protein GEV09_08085 [Pseudonocardiaceae bacterium]|nr:hypothetical protein [Pseudonocardiaceae bacterium]
MGRAPHRHWHPVTHPRGVPALLPVIVVIVVIAVGGLVAVISVVATLLNLAPVVLLAVGAVAVASRRNRRRRAAAPRQAHERIDPPASDWSATRARFTRLQQEYARFECDPLAVLQTPALADVTIPSTGRFVEAFAEAQALDTDAEPPASHRERFATAVDRAWRAWHAARDAAERIRLAGIPQAERATVERAIKLLTVARDSTNDAERTTAYARARAELGKLERSGTLRLPVPATAALDRAGRGQLPPGPNGG